MGSGYRVWGLVYNLGFDIRGLGYRIKRAVGLKIRVWGLGFRV